MNFSCGLSNELLHDYYTLINEIGHLKPSQQAHDTTIWFPHMNKHEFSVKRCYDSQMVIDTKNEMWLRIWKSPVIPRAKFLLWKAACGKTPSQVFLQSKGMTLVSCCVLCKQHEETTAHIFIHCPTTLLLWNYALKCFGLDWVMPNRVEELLEQWVNCQKNSKYARMMTAFVAAIFETIWFTRNNAIFNDVPLPKTEVLIQSISEKLVLWIYKNFDTAGEILADMLTHCRIELE